MDTTLDELKNHPRVFDLYASRVALTKGSANRFRASCPFGEHRDKNPSFDVYLQGGLWMYGCFSCGAKGNIFQFIEAVDKTDFKSAVKTVREWCSDWSQNRDKVENVFKSLGSPEQKKKTYSEAEYRRLEEALQNSPEAKAFLLSRGISAQTAKSLRVGFRQDVGKLAGESGNEMLRLEVGWHFRLSMGSF